MKDNSKTRKLLADLRNLYVQRGCKDLSCAACIKMYREAEEEKAKIKEQLKNLPHIPNKKEAKQLRQKKAKKRK